MRTLSLAVLACGVATARQQQAAPVQCKAKCGSQIGFVRPGAEDIFIDLAPDGTLTVPQQCRAEQCNSIETDLAATKATLAASLADIQQLHKLVADLATRHDAAIHEINSRTAAPTSAPTAAPTATPTTAPTAAPTTAPTPVPPTPAPTPAPTPPPAGYTLFSGKNAYNGHGAENIDLNEVSGLSIAQCTARCDADSACSCVTYDASLKDCWKRGKCNPEGFASGEAYDTYVKAPESISGSLTISGAGVDLLQSGHWDKIGAIPGFFLAQSNPGLTAIDGLNKVTSVGGNFNIEANKNLASINGFQSLTTIRGAFFVEGNPSLTSFAGFSNLRRVYGVINFAGNGPPGTQFDYSGLDKLECHGGVRYGNSPGRNSPMYTNKHCAGCPDRLKYLPRC